MNINDKFWDASLEDLKRGYVFETSTDTYTCLICGKTFEKGFIYKHEEVGMEAEKAVKVHIKSQHGTMFDFLMGMDKKYTGLTELQKELLGYFNMGYSDKEILELTGGGSTSTIRNHRFTLKEREKQAKIFLTIMSFLDSGNKSEKLVSIHRGAKMVDERYSITEQEKEKIIDTYFEGELKERLSSFPSREKRKIVVLQYIMSNFDRGRRYTEKEVNEKLERIYSDYVTIRRYLIEYGFMDREKDCSYYWIKE